MSNWDEEDRRANETKRGLDDARDGRNNPPSDPEGRQAYEAGRNVHVEDENRRRYADQVADGAASFNADAPSANSYSGGSVFQGFGALAFVFMLLVFTLIFYKIVTLPLEALRMELPLMGMVLAMLAIFFSSLFAALLTQIGRKIFLFGVPTLITLLTLAGGLRSYSTSNGMLFAVAMIGCVAFGLCWVAYNHLENEAPL